LPDGTVFQPQCTVCIDEVIETKLAMLACHESQQQWLQSTQKMNSYLQTMLDLCGEVGSMSGHPIRYAEGWTKHLHLGFGPADFDPLDIVALRNVT
jgi:hypothetical protein